MLKKTINYVDFNGLKRTEDHYFNLTKAEIMEMELGTVGGFSDMLTNIVKTQDTPSIVKIFKKLILAAYGVKSPDGRRFIKNDEVRDDFAQTEAYSTLFMELATDAKKAAEFVNGIIPADLAEEVAKSSGVRDVAPSPVD